MRAQAFSISILSISTLLLTMGGFTCGEGDIPVVSACADEQSRSSIA